ncbi:MAG: alpha/beta hydrolase-fold protein [Reichenbachiella sp.]
MNRTQYDLGIYLVGLYFFLTSFDSLVYFYLGTATFSLPSFYSWSMFLAAISYMWQIIVFKYYHDKKYSLAFASGVFSVIISLCYLIVVFDLLAINEWQKLFAPAYLALSGAGMLHTAILIFSNTKERPWLKRVGVCFFISYLTMFSAFIWNLNVHDVWLNTILDKVLHWTPRVSNLFLVFFIMNFLSELKQIKLEKASETQSRNSKRITEGVAILIAIVAFLFVGKVVIDSYTAAPRTKVVARGVQRLAQSFDARTYVSSQNDTMRYRLLKPLDYNPQKKYPLVVCLHHGGAHGTDNIRQIEGSSAARLLSKQINRSKYPAFIFVPQCPPGAHWGGIPYQPGVDYLVFEMIDELEKEFGIDEKRRYVIGQSMGGSGSWHFVCSRPEMFAAAIPICGYADPNLAENMASVPVWAFHGAKDKLVPVRFSRDMIQAIKKVGGNPLYTEVPDGGHNIWWQVSSTPGLLDWLFAQRRE